MSATYTMVTGSPTPVGVSKSKVFIGTTTTTPGNDAFIEIADVESVPQFGASANPIKTQTLNSGEITSKGVTTYGSGDLTCVLRSGDAGQAALIAAGADYSGSNYNIRIIGPDKATSTGTGTIYDMKALIMGSPVVVGGPNNVYSLKATLGYNSDVTKTAAT